ncbi:MAG: imm68 putative immunity domain-containing protein [Corynebacterium sp.]|uniref:imm68 putative immunity domain-containing protein n=1 Tax=Corynebacterium sp. TaxID=1720 RepID=UPI0026DC62AB|nr:imm68 putative immunity domain-containing protein [Corynebacterium sp.]MDO4762616.1 imm68 putative immunity domain-containing protein [Corynebacterium sp.]
MMIERYWGRFFGEHTDSQELVRYLDTLPEVCTLEEIFTQSGLKNLGGDLTAGSIDFTVGENTFHAEYAFLWLLDVAVLLLESKRVGRFNLARIRGARSRMMRIDSSPKEFVQLTQAMKYFSLDPYEFSCAQLWDEDELDELCNLCEEIRVQLD